MKVIGCFGRKGGSGKSMVAHLLAHGLSRGYGIVTNVVVTDVRDKTPMMMTGNRKYFVSSISNQDANYDVEQFQLIFMNTAKFGDSVLIIDGGANRSNLDHALAPICDLVLVPMGISDEDVAVAERDYWDLDKTLQKKNSDAKLFIIRNRWPGVGRKRDSLLSKPWISAFMQRADKTGCLFFDFVPDMASLVDMANVDDPNTTPLVDSIAVGFAAIVAKSIGLELPERLKLGPYGKPKKSDDEDTTKQGGDDGAAAVAPEGNADAVAAAIDGMRKQLGKNAA